MKGPGEVGHKDTRPEHNAHHTHSSQNRETPPPLDENHLYVSVWVIFKYPVITYSGRDEMVDTMWTQKSTCQLYIQDEEPDHRLWSQTDLVSNSSFILY